MKRARAEGGPGALSEAAQPPRRRELERRAPSNPLSIRRHGVPFGPFPGEGEALDTTLGRSLHNPLDEEAPSAGVIRGRNQRAQSAIRGRHHLHDPVDEDPRRVDVVWVERPRGHELLHLPRGGK